MVLIFYQSQNIVNVVTQLIIRKNQTLDLSLS